MTVVNTFGDISPRTAVRASKRLLKVFQPLVHTQRFGQKDTQEGNSGLVRKWRRYSSFPAAPTPLVEGVTPPGQPINYTDYVATLQQYGDKVTLTDIIADTHEDPILREMTDKLGMQAAQVIELSALEVLKSGTNVYYANAVAGRTSVVATVSRGDIRRIVRTLDRALAQPITSIIKATPDIATEPVDAAFFALAHTDLIPDLKNCTGFTAVKNYSNPAQALPGEVGAVDRVRFICTQNLTPWIKGGGNTTTMLSGGVKGSTTASDVYPIIVFGMDAYGTVRLQGMDSAKVFVLNPGVARGGDELGQRGSVGWKMMAATAILNQAWLVRYEVACTAEPA